MMPELEKAALAMELHELSMSREPHLACYGRIAKELSPLFERLIVDEHQRGMHPSEIAVAMGDLFGDMILSMGLNWSDKGRALGFVDSFMRYLNVAVVVGANKPKFHALVKAYDART